MATIVSLATFLLMFLLGFVMVGLILHILNRLAKKPSPTPKHIIKISKGLCYSVYTIDIAGTLANGVLESEMDRSAFEGLINGLENCGGRYETAILIPFLVGMARVDRYRTKERALEGHHDWACRCPVLIMNPLAMAKFKRLYNMRLNWLDRASLWIADKL